MRYRNCLANSRHKPYRISAQKTTWSTIIQKTDNTHRINGEILRALLDEVRKHDHILTPGRYVGAPPAEADGEPFEDKMQRLVAQLREQRAEGARLDAAIADNLKTLGFGRD